MSLALFRSALRGAVREAQDEAPPPAPPAPPTNADVLRRVARGELSVDEALAVLERRA